MPTPEDRTDALIARIRDLMGNPPVRDRYSNEPQEEMVPAVYWPRAWIVEIFRGVCDMEVVVRNSHQTMLSEKARAEAAEKQCQLIQDKRERAEAEVERLREFHVKAEILIRELIAAGDLHEEERRSVEEWLDTWRAALKEERKCPTCDRPYHYPAPKEVRCPECGGTPCVCRKVFGATALKEEPN